MSLSKLFHFVAGCIFSLHAHSQIPNGDFEEWDTINNDEVLIGWDIAKGDTFPYCDVIKDTLPVSGLFALHLKREHHDWIMATTGFPIETHPYALHGWYRAKTYATFDSIITTVKIFQGGVVVDSGSWLMNQVAIFDWTPFLVNISNNSILADSASISFFFTMHSAVATSEDLYIDHLFFDDYIGIFSSNSTNSLQLFPNPADDKLTFTFEDYSYTATILNSVGVTVMQQSFSNCSNPLLEVAELTPGIYILQINSGNRKRNQKFIKQ